MRPLSLSSLSPSSTVSNIFGPSLEGGTKVYINGPGHIIKIAATPIYGKNL